MNYLPVPPPLPPLHLVMVGTRLSMLPTYQSPHQPSNPSLILPGNLTNELSTCPHLPLHLVMVCTHLSMLLTPSLRRVLGEEVYPEGDEDLARGAVFPEQLSLAYRNNVLLLPYLDQEKFTQGQYFLVSVQVVFERFVECVIAMMATGRPHKLEKKERERDKNAIV